MSDEALDKLFSTPQVPIKVSMLSPLRMFLDTDGLQRLVRRSLKGLVAQRNEAEDLNLIDQAIQQRIDFLGYLQVFSDPEIYMAMYPDHEDGLDDDGVWEILNNLPDPK